MSVTLVQTINIFQGLQEQNATFCIDISGSMYGSLQFVKAQLINYLEEQSLLAKFNINRMFNVIAFSTEVYPWGSGSVLWNSATVQEAVNWINDLETKTGTNTLDALLTAFGDSQTDSVVLVTDDISDQDPYTVLNQVSAVARGRPVHSIYISNRLDEDQSAMQFLQNLSSMTNGSFKIVTVGRHGIEKITPVVSQNLCSMYQMTNLAQNSTSNTEQQICLQGKPTFLNSFGYGSSMLTNSMTSSTAIMEKSKPNFMSSSSFFYNIPTIQSIFNTYAHPKWLQEPTVYSFPSYVSFPRVLITEDGKIPYKSIAWSRFRPVKVLHNGNVVGLSVQDSNLPIFNDIAYTPDAGSLLLNKTVVARSSLDGYYYKGKVLNQILAHRFNIQFGPNQHGNYKDCTYQDTAVYDIIHYDDAISHPIKENDKCLALIDGSEKYAPAEVLEGSESRGLNSQNENSYDQKLTVKFMNGKTRSLSSNEAIWIPDAVYDRIKFELNLPSAARKYLEEYNDDYPNKSLPGYPTTNMAIKNAESVIMPRLVYDIWPYYVPFYPYYSKILYPSAITTGFVNSHKLNMSNSIGNLVTTANNDPAVYYRSIRSNMAAVDADSINRNVYGTMLTPEKLDEKIREQIYQHRHLLSSSSSLSSKLNEKSSRSDNCCSCSCKSNQNATIVHSHSQCQPCEKVIELENNRHLINTECDASSESLNKHHELYKRLVKELYSDLSHSLKFEEKKSLNDSSNHLRSKSVTFSDFDDVHTCKHGQPLCDHHKYEHEGASDDGEDDNDYRGVNKSISINTDVTFGKRESLSNKKRPNNLANNVPDRFGNPNVNIGLPDRNIIKQRPRSASGELSKGLELDESFNIQNLMQKQRRDLVAKRENIRQENLANESKKQEAVSQHHKQSSIKIAELDKKRTDDKFLKSQDINAAKRLINSQNIERFNSNKIDIEAKEQKKYANLRNQTIKRNEEHQNNLKEIALKEANKLAFKQLEQQKRNVAYHNKLLQEEAYRNMQQKYVEMTYNRTKVKEAQRENKEQKYKQLIKEAK